MTATNITSLELHQIFVFGSNLNGWHTGGAANQAKLYFEATEGQSMGRQGKCYAIPTLDESMKKLSLSEMKLHIEIFKNYAIRNNLNEFLLTPIGTGIAGFSLQEIKSILPEFPPNVKLIGTWEEA